MPTWRMCKTISSERREKYPTDTSLCGTSILVVECYEYKLPTKKFLGLASVKKFRNLVYQTAVRSLKTDYFSTILHLYFTAYGNYSSNR